MQFHELPDHSRVWIYQADRMLSEAEVSYIRERAHEFVKNWSAHGSKLHAAIDVIDRLFLIIMVDEDQAAASGCSIDKSVAFVKALEKEFGISFMDRMKVAVESDAGLEIVSLHDLPALHKAGRIQENTVVFNNLVNTKKEFNDQWRTIIANSWHQRFLN